MSAFEITAIKGKGHPDPFTGLIVKGIGTPGDTVKVHYEIPSSGVMSSDLPATVQKDDTWEVDFSGEFSVGTTVTVIAKESDGSDASKTVTLPKSED